MNLLAALVPYVVVLIGMMLLKSAWLAILLYHLGILLFFYIRKPAGLRKRLLTGWDNPRTLVAVLTCALTGRAWILMIPYFSFIHPLLEEIHWRETKALPYNAKHLLFAGYHVLVLHQLIGWPWLIMVFVILAGSSLFWQWAASRYGGYALPVLTHIAADATVIVSVCLLLIK